MKKDAFLNDVNEIYEYLSSQKENINKLISCLENKEYDKLEIINDFAKKLDLEMSDDLRFSLVTRLVSLRDDSLVQVLKKLNLSEKEIIELQEKAYLFVKEFWHKKHKTLIDYINHNELLNPFYRAIFEGVYNVGLKMSSWQSSWTSHIINGVNKDLMNTFHQDEEKVFDFLENNKLFDIGHNDIQADRSYSALVKSKDGYRSEAYIKSFKSQTTAVVDALEEFEESLIELEDDVYNQKWEYILYIQNLIKAFSEDKTHLLVSRWADVDRAWMKITSPIQIGHPLEYYEDHFRKAVALEWDIRLSNPEFALNDNRVNKIKKSFSNIFSNLEDSNSSYKSIYDFSLKSLDKVQLYIGRPAIFFGAEFNGLFSAQVVPNDEVVSKEEGKKIFAFSDEILQSSRAKPFLKLSKDIFGQDFLKKDREFLFGSKDTWHNVYDITTIGHEFGHILWCDEETETLMNKSGNFKNIEEFKATTGGLVSLFLDDEDDEKHLEKHVLVDTVKRAIGLIGWMQVAEVQAYYCEALIHLSIMFDSKILKWENDSLSIDLSENTYKDMKRLYVQTYTSLAKHYLDKKDAGEFLNIYAKKENKYFMPINENINSFVKYYFKKYQEIGQELDTSDKKENYKK
ncbi:MAG: invasion protein CiaB [Campylobacteraceae bacterium]|nr:invasion protein CiaB [Campylobacteraceae bacterium]